MTKSKPNGFLRLDLGWKGAGFKFVIAGGPYNNYVPGPNTFGVCVRAEHPRPNHLHVPIHDFSTPEDDDPVRAALLETLKAAIDGKEVYVGCMGGWGRTGLFLALLAKVAGIPDPVGYVRMFYSSRAVETIPQEDYVAELDVSSVRRKVLLYAWRKRLSPRRLFKCN